MTCASCGCRLTKTGDAWFHFNPLGGRDARGCRVDCVDAAHDASGSRRLARRLGACAAPQRAQRAATRYGRPQLLVDDDPIAHAPDRDDVRAAGRIDLRAQPREMRLEPQQVRVGLGRPAGTGQLEVRDDVAAGADERLEQPELRRRQRERRLPDPRLVTSRLQDQRAGLERTRRRRAPDADRSTRRMIAAIRASSSALPNGFVR